MIAAPATLGGLVAELAGLLREAGVPAARQEALRLVRDLLGPEGPDPVLAGDRPAPAGLRRRCLEAARRRANGEPIAYVTGRAGFRHLELAVDRRVLIPRPETEQLVELVLAAVPEGRIIEVGAGSGCVALSLSAEGRYRDVVATDISREALAVAAANARRVHQRVHLVAGDLLEPVRGGRFDAVVSNPPYLSEADYGALDPSVRAWEPRVALVGGEDGMAVVGRLLAGAGHVLRPGGLLALEVDASRAGRTAALARTAGWRDVAVIKDLFGRDRFVTARRGTDDD